MSDRVYYPNVRYAISRRVLFSEKDLLRDESGYAWVDSIPVGTMAYDIDYLSNDCIRTSMYLVGKSDESATESISPYVKALSALSEGERPPLSLYIPREKYKAHTTSIIEKIEQHLATPSYYDLHYRRHTKIFDSLQRACVDSNRISYHSAEEAANRPVLVSFLPDADGLARPIRYDRLSGRTGRLKVASGPSILTLKKEHRDVLRTRFPGGKIISVDYSSLEARAFLYLAGASQEDCDDIYESMAKKLFSGEFPRHVVKAVVISLLYGMGDAALGVKLNLDKPKVRKLSRSVRKHFRYDEFKSNLESKLRGDTIENSFGRVISVPDERLLLNTYVQSSAVDIVLSGFLKIVESVPSEVAIPIFVLHDALIMDVSSDFDVETVRVAERIDGFSGCFPVHVSAF